MINVNKKTGLNFVLCFVQFVMLSNVSFAQNSLSIADTRFVNELPGDFSRQVKFDFKLTSVVGVPGLSFYSSMMTLAPWGDYTGGKNHQLNFNDGGIFYRTGMNGSSWDSWQRLVIENNLGNVGIGTTTPDEKLAVNGRIHAREVKVDMTGWPDYVFNDDYKNLRLSELEQYIKINKHLPDVPSASTVENEGLALGEMNKILLKKVEELTLHLIEKDKQIKELKKLEEKIADLDQKINKIIQDKSKIKS